MRFASLCTSAAGFLLAALAVLLLFAPVRSARSETPPGITCSMINGVYVCTDGSLGGSGDTCVTDQVGNRVCTGAGGQPPSGGGSSGNLGPGWGRVLKPSAPAAGTGWLSMLTHWVAYAINVVFAAFVAVLRDLITAVVVLVLALVSAAIDAIGVPDFLAGKSLGSLLGQTGSVAGFFMTQLRIWEGLALVGAGYVFRIIRKLVTLFQW